GVRHVDVVAGIDGQPLRPGEQSGRRSVVPPLGDELASRGELLKPVPSHTRIRADAVEDVDVPLAVYDDAPRETELTVGTAVRTELAKQIPGRTVLGNTI